jgi:saccharopine dehydrogenase-like NADP-dependent oxidoreductase
MKKILVLGAGLSASSLIRYLLAHAEKHDWEVRITDRDKKAVEAKIGGNSRGVALDFDALDPAKRESELAGADLVISMLPARFHTDIARDCIRLKKHLITPSYISGEMKALHGDAQAAGILIMNEIGVDPGIDHMSAMKIIDEVREKGGKITSFKSFCGGLIAPESDNNPWNYKFTWNPRNVVLAGSGGAAQYIDKGQYKFIPYQRLFERLDHMSVGVFGDFEGYANRDSLSYRAVYGLEDIPTLYRGTLRRPDYCSRWNIFVQLGMTDDSYSMPDSADLTPRAFVNAFLPYDDQRSVEEKFADFCADRGVTSIEPFVWLGLFSAEKTLGLEDASPAQLLEEILKEKLVLEDGDKDMLVMVHRFEYELDSQTHTIQSSMVNIGEDEVYTSMSNTVGLPIAICAKMVLNGDISLRGVQLPVMKDVYAPILRELEEYGVAFTEEWG